MTKLLAEAFAKASFLTDELQDQLARELLDEIESESRWDHTLAATQDKLDLLAERAEQDYHAGKTQKIGFDEL